MIARGLTATLALAILVGAARAQAPIEDVHDLVWKVHTDMIGTGTGQLTLAEWTTLIEERLARADTLIRGTQGPADETCCVRLDAASVASFGSPGDGLDTVDDLTEFDAVDAFGPGAYLVEHIHYCGGSTSSSIRGCADTPGDFMVVGREADETDFLPIVIAHERGHNAGLNHVTNDPCELLSASSGGGCLSGSECASFQAKADSTGSACACHGPSQGDPPLANGSSCTDGSGCGACSGGECGACTAGYAAGLLIAGGIEDAQTATPDDGYASSPITGGWEVLGAVGGGGVTGLAYASNRGTMFGAQGSSLITIDPSTGAKTGTVGSFGSFDVIALAFDPDTDTLYGIHVDDEIFSNPFDCGSDPVCISSLLDIDPDTGSATELGELNALIIGDGVEGLAYDAAGDTLYGSTRAGLFEIDVSSCNGTSCSGTTQVDNIFRSPSSLAWEATSGKLLRQGSLPSSRTEFDVIDPTTGEREARIGIDAHTPGGLAAFALPTIAMPSVGPLGLGILALLLGGGAGWAARRRGR